MYQKDLGFLWFIFIVWKSLNILEGLDSRYIFLNIVIWTANLSFLCTPTQTSDLTLSGYRQEMPVDPTGHCSEQCAYQTPPPSLPTQWHRHLK